MSSVRLDIATVQRGLAESRNKAQGLIDDGCVSVNGVIVTKPSVLVYETDSISLVGNTCPYVSRGGLKLEKALDAFSVDPRGCVCGDFGASTGGFTDCLLQRGAAKVYAVDVGANQLADKLRYDPRVVVIENTNVRSIAQNAISCRLDLAVVDLSFISLQMVLSNISSFLSRNGAIICLIKPQFEAGREGVGKHGVIRSPKTHNDVLRGFCTYAASVGLYVQNLTFSPIKGGEGNIEFLALLTDKPQHNPPDIAEVVAKAHQQL